MEINVLVAPVFSKRVVRADLRQTALKTLRAEKVSDSSGASIVIVSDAVLRGLNRRFHGVNATTDVLSFPSDEKNYLGDILISYETARVNARAARWTIKQELELLVVHGLLHLLGYADTDPKLREKMWKRQGEILGRGVVSGYNSFQK